MLMGCFGSFGASVSLKIPSFKNGCFYVHNIFLSFWKARPMVWGSSVPPALCALVSSAAQTVLVIQSGAKVVVYQATCPYPSPDPDLGWRMFRKVISSQTRFCHAPGTQWTILPSPEEPLGRCVNGWSRRRGGARGRST